MVYFRFAAHRQRGLAQVVPICCTAPLLLFCAVACSEPPLQTDELRQLQRDSELSLRDALAPRLAASLVGDKFNLVVPADAEVEIASERAKALAVAFVRRFGKYNRTVLEGFAGFPLRFDELRADDRVLFAQSRYAPLGARYSRPSRKALGGYYLVTLRQDGVPVISVAVSALAGDLTLRDGRIIPPKIYGNEFVLLGIPRGVEYPISPERAVRLASEETAARVVENPVLLAPGVQSFYAPQYASWRIVLDRRVLASTGPSVDTIYIGWSGDTWIASPSDGPDHADVTLSGVGHEIASLHTRSGVPARVARTSFETGRQP